jgi:hypothetical protein
MLLRAKRLRKMSSPSGYGAAYARLHPHRCAATQRTGRAFLEAVGEIGKGGVSETERDQREFAAGD